MARLYPSMMTNAELVEKNTPETIRELARRLPGVMGRVACGLTYAENELLELAQLLTDTLVGGWKFEDLLGAWEHDRYRPTMRADIDARFTILADLYDFFQAKRGNGSAQAHRG